MKPLSGRIAAKLMRMDEASWTRHTNPWSGWTRLTTLPLLSLAIWSRVWLGWWALLPVAIVLVWIWLNPRIFSAPLRTDNWMSRGVLGERIWLESHARVPAHHRRMARNLSVGSFLGLMVLGWGLIKLDLGFTVAGLAVTSLTKLWLIDRMVWLERDSARGTARANSR